MQTPSNREEALARAARGELLGPMDVAAILCLGPSRFNTLNQEGRYDFLKCKPPVGVRCFSGVKVHRYYQGELVDEPVFGRHRRQA